MTAVPLVALLLVAIVIVPAVLIWRRGERLALQADVAAAAQRMRRELAGLSVEELKQRVRESRYFAHAEAGGAMRDTGPVRRFLACLEADDYRGCAGALTDFPVAEKSIGCTHPPMIPDFDIIAIVDELERRALNPFR
jgi:hypothetical protein